jgi:hypothetical protein
MNHSSTLTQSEPQLHNNRLGQAQYVVRFLTVICIPALQQRKKIYIFQNFLCCNITGKSDILKATALLEEQKFILTIHLHVM